MTEHGGDPGLVTPGPAADGLTAEQGLTGLARPLGRQHHSAPIAPFGDVDHVYWDERSARLLGALGVTAPTTADNIPGRQRLVDAYCDEFEGRRARGRRSRLMTASISPGVFAASLVAAEGGGFHSG